MKRTDLAIDLEADEKAVCKKVTVKSGVKVTEIEIKDSDTARKIGKEKGKYITVEFESPEHLSSTEEIKEAIIKALETMIDKGTQKFLVIGLGNSDITSDSIGPLSAGRILASRHITGELAHNIGLDGLKSVAVVTPNVLGKTGIETAELVKGIADKIKPQVIIVIDALASSSVFRLFRTVQITDTGISPGSGVKNSRKEISRKTLGVPVIAIGVPTVMEASEMVMELSRNAPKSQTDMILTPKDCDLLCEKISDILSLSLNFYLQPDIDREILLSLV